MAALDKLVKALEGLKIMKDSTISDESVRRKEKAILCVTVADLMCSPAARTAPKLPSYLSYSMETLLHMCDDPDSNIRMAADESLNRIIRAMMESNIVKVLVELHKEIKANGKARSLRAALWRFGELAHMIRPQKGKPFIQNLVPCIIQIAKRTEELVLETLATAMPKIFLALGTFTTDNDVKSLLKTFLANLSSDNTVVRRTAASSILAVCLHCRKPQIFLSYTLNTIVESILPVKDDQSIPELLGVLNLTRQLLPHFCNSSKEDVNSLNSSLGVPATSPDSSPPIDRFIQVYELCLHWSQHRDQNVVTGSLETLLQLLSCNLPQLISVLTAPAGLTRTRILPSDNSNKLSSRTLSQMSIVTSSVPADESALLDGMEDCPQFKGGQVEQWVQSTVTSMFPNRVSDSTQDETDQEYMSEVESEPPSMRPLAANSLHRAPSLESEQLIGRDDSPSPPPTNNVDVKQVWDIGTVIDTGPALVHCARHLFVKFLLPEEAGIRVRVSVRALALNCLSQVLRIMPRVFLIHIDRRRQTTSNGVSHVSDVLSFATHPDQQIRGLTGTLIGYLVKSALCEGRASYSDWSNSNHPSDLPLGTVLSNATSEKQIPLSTLISLMVQGLEDESYVCVRHTLTGVSTCLEALLGSKDSPSCIPILHALTALSNNPYWLIKVKTVELLSSLNYLTIHYVIGNSSFQDKLFNMVLITQLGDQDSRVRKATAEAISKVVDNLFYPIDHSPEDLVTTLGIFLRQHILSGLFDQESQEFSKPKARCETVLSRIVSMLSHLLLQSTSKFLTAGCCETLGLLSLKYPCNEYPRGWQCKLGRISSNSKSTVSASSGLLATVLAYLMTSSSVSLDLDIHSWLLLLAGNLLAGLAESGLQSVDTKADYDKTQLWAALHDKKLAVFIEHLLSHVMRMLSVFVMVIEDVPAQSQRGIAPSPVKRRTSRGSSPAKVPPSADKESVNIIPGSINKEEKGKSFGHFSHLRHYCKLHENLIAAYSNYKISLEGGASEKFVNLLRVVLKTLGHILEYSGVAESGRIAEELLHSLCVTVALEPTSSIKTVQQLLKSLFGANYLARWDEEKEGRDKRQVLSNLPDGYSGFYYSVFHQPYTKLGDYLEINSKTCTEIPRTGPSYVRERISNSRNNTGRNSDKASLASYIRLFEPMVIQALKKYTVTSCVSIQIAVLDLLSQLVQLRVNYCLLDSDQIFITFIHKQFDFLEEGQIRRAEELIPKLFQFLIYLSHEKNHSKSVTSFSRVIQLCAGLMASGQNPVTHCIPALLPVVEHAFLSSNPPGDVKELETQREFLITMLLRLVEYPQVLHLLSLILGEGWRWEERWRKLSRHTADTILPKLAQGKIILEKPADLASLLQLLNSLASGTLRPVDQVLKVLFTAQQPEDGCSTERWLSVVLAMCVALGCQGREDTVLSRLEELQLCVHQQGDDPLNVIAAQHNHPPQLIFAKLLLHVIESVVSKLETASKQCEDTAHVENLFAHFLLVCLHMFQSGSYVQVATALIQLVREPEGGERLKAVNSSFTAIASCCPLITLLWSYLLTLINYGHTSYWSVLMQTRDRDKIGAKHRSQCIDPDTCHNLEVVRRGAIILYSDYVTENVADSECLTWLIVGHVEELIGLSTEPPVQELLAAIQRNPAASGLMVQAVASRCTHISQVKFLCKLLTCLETVHPRDSGAVLKLLAPILLKHPHLVITKRSTTLASRRVEFLLTLEKSEVMAQIDKEDLQKLIESLSSSFKLAIKHSGLLSLLNKLSSQCFDLSPVELDQGRPINAANIRMITLDRAWFLSQVKLRCCGKGKNGTQCAQLLSNLDEEDIIGVLRSEDFDNAILQHCFTLGIRLTLQAKDGKKDSDTAVSPLFKAARRALLHHIHHLHSLLPRVHQAYNPAGRQATVKESKYKDRIDELFCDSEFIEAFFKLVPAVGSYMQASKEQLFEENGQTSCSQPKDFHDDIIKFAILCVESIVWLSSTKMPHWGKWPSCIQSALECSVSIFEHDYLVALLSPTHISSVASCAVHLLQRNTDHTINTPTIPGDIDATSNIHTSYQMAALISILEKSPPSSWDLPQFMSINIKKLIVSVGRSPLVNWHCRTPQEGWGGPPDPCAAPPILSPQLLQDGEVLSLLVFRLSLLGWTNRQQFEETWMTLLSVVTANSSNDSENEQSSSSIQGNSLTVKALSTLLLQTTLTPDPGNPGTGKLLHCPRDEPIDLSAQSWGAKYEAATNALYWKLDEFDNNASSHVYLPRLNERVNVERINSTDRYGYGQVSVKYLKTNVMSSDERATVPSETHLCKMCLEQQQRLASLSIDLQSCLQFLLDLYSQWMHPDCGVSLSVLLEIVRSTISLSDLFIERSHFSWMLDMCLELSRTHPLEDEIMHQYLVLAVCKAASVLPTLETDVIERILKLLENALKASFLPARHSALHGLLYLLQSHHILETEEPVEQKPPVVDTRQRLLQASLDYITRNLTSDVTSESSEDSLLALFALVFYTLEHAPETLVKEIPPTLIQLTQNVTSSKSINLYQALIQGLDRLVLLGKPEGIREQTTRLATELLAQSNPAIFLPALQLLLSCTYSGEYDKGKEREDDAEVFVAAIEKTSTLFNRIKRAYLVEAECVCTVLPFLLGDFFPAAKILSKVIGEFLAPTQPHPRLLAPVVFKVFDQACSEDQLPLLQAWVVMSLGNFTQCLPMPMATWCLSCFFISASTNPWLRALFPHVQSRIGRCSYEDRKLLCISAANFYGQLTDESQKQAFLRTFSEAALQSPKSPFSDIIDSISQTSTPL